MDRLELIQKLIKRRQFENYLEIGVLGGFVFFQIECKNKIAVDPEFKFNWRGKVGEIFRNFSNLKNQYYEVTSDEFFEKYAHRVFKNKRLDISLIDGMHEFRYVLNDVSNCLEHLSDDGVLVLHDCNPQSSEAECSFEEWKQRGYTGYWNGDTWKAITYLFANRADLNVFVADCDHGLGIITRRKTERVLSDRRSYEEIAALNYEDLEKNRQQFLNLQPAEYLEQFFELQKETA